MNRSRTFAPAVASIALVFALGSPVYAAARPTAHAPPSQRRKARFQAGDAAGVGTYCRKRQADAVMS